MIGRFQRFSYLLSEVFPVNYFKLLACLFMVLLGTGLLFMIKDDLVYTWNHLQWKDGKATFEDVKWVQPKKSSFSKRPALMVSGKYTYRGVDYPISEKVFSSKGVLPAPKDWKNDNQSQKYSGKEFSILIHPEDSKNFQLKRKGWWLTLVLLIYSILLLVVGLAGFWTEDYSNVKIGLPFKGTDHHWLCKNCGTQNSIEQIRCWQCNSDFSKDQILKPLNEDSDLTAS